MNTTQKNKEKFKGASKNGVHLSEIPQQKTSTQLPENELEYLFKPNSKEQLREELKNITPGIKTRYTIKGFPLRFQEEQSP